jgi:hypothetical protein
MDHHYIHVAFAGSLLVFSWSLWWVVMQACCLKSYGNSIKLRRKSVQQSLQNRAMDTPHVVMIMCASAKYRDPLNYIVYTLDGERRRCAYVRSTCILSKVLYHQDTCNAKSYEVRTQGLPLKVLARDGAARRPDDPMPWKHYSLRQNW